MVEPSKELQAVFEKSIKDVKKLQQELQEKEALIEALKEAETTAYNRGREDEKESI